MPSELSEFHFKDLQCQKSLYMSSNFIPTKLMSQTNCSFRIIFSKLNSETMQAACNYFATTERNVNQLCPYFLIQV